MAPPFRADHVGSLLRPARLRKARARRERGELSAATLRSLEDECIREAVRWQEELGLRSITDGEFRRGFYHTDFLGRLEGVTLGRTSHQVQYRGERKQMDFEVPMPAVTGRLRRASSMALEEFDFLSKQTSLTAKVCIPAPSTLHFRCTLERSVYPDAEEFFDDLVRVYREELEALYAAGCRYVQIDDPHIGFLCDAAQASEAHEQARLYAQLIERSIRARPRDLAVCVHVCRGNFSKSGAARGGYEPVAETVFAGIGADGFFLEFDDERSGGFEPLRWMSRGRKVVLGLVSTKTPQLEEKAGLRRKIELAAKIVPLEDLCLSPQCGFSSTQYGTDLTQDEQAAKLRRVVEVAAEVWGAEP
jgi:5-methyltetrahydropteroyltriglutamate--homocysteine methyltransferase